MTIFLRHDCCCDMRAARTLQRPSSAPPTRTIHTAPSMEPRGGAGAFPAAPEGMTPLRRAIATVGHFPIADYHKRNTLESALVEPDPGGATPQTRISIES